MPSTPAVSTITVLLVDDNALLAESMPRVLAKDARFAWAGWVEDSAEVIERVRTVAPNLVLMDVDMPGVDTFDLVRELATKCPASKVVMFSGHVRGEYADAAVDAGAYGYLHKDDEFPALLNNLAKAHAGEMVMSPLIQRTLWRKI
jgi:DNA-binding NarL/FixJ family response regulator